MHNLKEQQYMRRTCVAQQALRTKSLTRSVSPLQDGAVSNYDNIILNNSLKYYTEVWSKGQVNLLDKIMAEDHSQYDMCWQPGTVGNGRRVMKRGILAYRSAYPDLEFRVLHTGLSTGLEGEDQEKIISSSSAPLSGSSSVFVRWNATGTNLGPIREQPPTGRSVSFSGISHLTFDEEGKTYPYQGQFRPGVEEVVLKTALSSGKLLMMKGHISRGKKLNK